MVMRELSRLSKNGFHIILATCLALMLCDTRSMCAMKKWTVMVYMCGDNDLESALIKDLNEMEKVGSSKQVNIVAQLSRSPFYDTSNGNWVGARRYFVTKDPYEDPSPEVPPNNTIRSQMVADLGWVNMGGKRALVDFVKWAVENYPAQRYFLILSDHGSGVRPFRRRLAKRAIIFSDSFDDYLSNSELKEALSEIKEKVLGGKELEILGYDASEMSMIENAYQVRHSAKYLIASQLSEPNDGYPYDRFLGTLVSNPDMPTEEFLREFVKHYMESYESGRPTNGAGSSVTIAVYRLGLLKPLVDAIDELAKALLESLPKHARTIEEIRQATQVFSESIYRDLYHFCELLLQRFPEESVKRAAKKVIDAHGPSEDGALLAEAHRSGFDINVDNAHGIAIYFPSPENFEAGYLTDLDFNRDCKWGAFLAARSTEDSLPPEIRFLFPASDGEKIILPRPMLVAEVRDYGYAGLNESSISVAIDGAKLATSEFTFESQSGLLEVRPTSQLKAGKHNITISASDNAGNKSSLSISFDISPQLLQKGVRMFSLPMGTTSPDPRVVLNDSSVMTARWDNSTSSYHIFPATDEQGYASFRPLGINVSVPPAGVGYFLRLKNDLTLTHPGEPVDLTQPYDVPLQAQGSKLSWHIVGNPFPVPIKLSSLIVVRDGITMTFEEALANNLILSPPFIYIPPQNPFAVGRYATVSLDFELQPFAAFWVAISGDLILRFPSLLQAERGKKLVSSPTSTLRSSGNSLSDAKASWRLRLVATCNGYSDSITLGVSPQGRLQHDHLDVLKPPSPPGAQTRIYVLQELFNGYMAQYEVSIQPPNLKAFWDIIVDATLGDVVLSWEGINLVPSSVCLTLTDLATGKALSMRHQSYVRLPRQDEPYRLRLSAQARSSHRGFIVGLSALTTKGNIGIRFTLLNDMNITIRLLTLTGRVIHVALQRKEMKQGMHTVGLPIPKGVNLQVAIVEVIGEDELGRVSRAFRIVRLQ